MQKVTAIINNDIRIKQKGGEDEDEESKNLITINFIIYFQIFQKEDFLNLFTVYNLYLRNTVKIIHY